MARRACTSNWKIERLLPWQGDKSKKLKIIYLCISTHDARAYASITWRRDGTWRLQSCNLYVLEKKLSADTTKLLFHVVQRVGKRSMAGADQLLQDMFVGKTGNLLHALMHTSRQSFSGGTEGIDQSYDESPRGTWSKRCQSERSIFIHKQWKIWL